MNTLNEYLNTNKTEIEPSSSSSEEENSSEYMENREEETDNEEEINNIVEDLGNLKIDNNEWKEELCYEKDSIFGFYKNPIHTNIIKESLSKIFKNDIKGKTLTPEYFFKLIIDNKLIENICNWTNEYYHKVFEPYYINKIKDNKNYNIFKLSHKKKWNDTTKKEIYTFLLI